MKKKNNPSISDSIKLIKNRVHQIREDSKDVNISYFDEIDYNLNEINKFIKGIKKLIQILFAISLFSVILFIISLYYNQKLQKLNSDLSGKKVDSLMTEILEIKTIEHGDTITTSYDYQTRNGEVITYNELVKQSDSLITVFDSISKETINYKLQLFDLRQKLKLAENNYGIKFKNLSKTEKGKKVNYIQMTAPKIDSGFMLLKEFHDRIYYDKDKNQWFVIIK